MQFIPELMKFENGSIVDTPQKMRERREEILRIFQNNAYGDMPSPVPVSGEIIEETNRCCSGNAVYYKIIIHCQFENSVFSFPVQLTVPIKEGKKPLIVAVNFSDQLPHEYIPVEEIIDNGFALAVVYYNDITNDSSDFSDKIAAFSPRTSSGHDAGKISMWAWSVSRALDYFLTRNDISEDRIAVIGHSRLGKTALWCAANDTRVRYVCSNDSGCMGAAYSRTRREGAESVSRIYGTFPYWFCENMKQYAENKAPMPFDQHMLIGAIAPRYVLVNSAGKDDWADPASEQNSCVGASPAWQVYGKKGYAGKEETYEIDAGDLNGDIGYYKRFGVHFLGRKDWLNFMSFIKNHY